MGDFNLTFNTYGYNAILIKKLNMEKKPLIHGDVLIYLSFYKVIKYCPNASNAPFHPSLKNLVVFDRHSIMFCIFVFHVDSM